MAKPPITPQQAAKVDRILAAYSDYLGRLAKRINRLESYPHPLPKWADQAAWSVSGLRIHFAEWAVGQEPFHAPDQI